MNTETFLKLREQVIKAGYGEEITWQESVYPPFDSKEFFGEYMWVVLSSGMKNQVARIIENRISIAWRDGLPTSSAFKHEGKVKAIDYVRANQERIFAEYEAAVDKVEYLATLPWIGNITKWHLAKNIGHDCVKPDRHLARIAAAEKTTPYALCKAIADETGYRIATVDLIIWRAANLGLV